MDQVADRDRVVYLDLPPLDHDQLVALLFAADLAVTW